MAPRPEQDDYGYQGVPDEESNVLVLRPNSNSRFQGVNTNYAESATGSTTIVTGETFLSSAEEEEKQAVMGSSVTSSTTPNGASSSNNNSNNNDGNSSKNLKFWLLCLLVAQGSSAILVGRYTRSSVPEDELYRISHLVFVIEWVKFIASCIAEYIHTGGKLMDSIDEHIFDNVIDSCKVLVPAVLYVMQNSLVYIALSNLTAPVFISLQQGKLIATALVSVLMLNRQYNVKQWICLFVLAVGVSIVALDERGDKVQTVMEAEEDLAETSSADEALLLNEMEAEGRKQLFLVGVLAVTGACFSSAFAGVYFEKVLAPEKANRGDTSMGKKTAGEATPTTKTKSQPSLWMRNIQLSFFSIIFAYLQGVYDNKKELMGADSGDIDISKPYLHGFTIYVWLLVALQAGGGLLVAAVMKYADNVLKGLAMGISVVVASVLSNLLFDVHLSSSFALGASIILASVYCFSNDIPCFPSSST